MLLILVDLQYACTCVFQQGQSFAVAHYAECCFVPQCHCALPMQDATQLALKIVTNYALSDAGITTYAAPGSSLGFMRKSFEVHTSSLQLYHAADLQTFTS